MAFVESALQRFYFAVARKRKALEIIQTSDAVSAEYLEIFLRYSSVSVGNVHQVGDRAVLKADRDRHVVPAVASRIREGRGHDRLHGAVNDGSRPVDEMTQLADNAATVLRMLHPAAARDKPGVAADVDEHGFSAAAEEVLQLFG